MKRKDRQGKTAVFIKQDENYKKFKAIVKESGMTVQGAIENFIRKVANGEIEIADVVRRGQAPQR